MSHTKTTQIAKRQGHLCDYLWLMESFSSELKKEMKQLLHEFPFHHGPPHAADAAADPPDSESR